MLKLNVKEGLNLPTGWKELTITKAEDGEHSGTRFIDLYFEGLPDNLNCRIWSAVNKETGQDFGIGNLFYYADAGLIETENGELSIDDDVKHLKGKMLNVYFYENEAGYTTAAQRVVPTIRDSFNESYVTKLKTRAEEWASKRVTKTTTLTDSSGMQTTTSEGAEITF